MDIPTVKIVIAGDLGTGKSSLVNFYVHSIFVAEFDPTIEVTYKKQVNINGRTYNIEIVDTVDNEFENEEKRKLMYQTCDVVILTYAIDNMESFNNLYLRYANLPINETDEEKKLTYLNGRIKYFPPIIVVGNKTDLEMSRQVDSHSAKKASKDLKISTFLQCSAATNYNVDELFETAIEMGYEYSQLEHDVTHIYAEDEDSQMRASERRNHSSSSSLVSRQSTSNIANPSTGNGSTSSNSPKNQTSHTKANDKIHPINENDSTTGDGSIKKQTKLKTKSNVSIKKLEKPSTYVSKAPPKPTSQSTSCCTIM